MEEGMDGSAINASTLYELLTRLFREETALGPNPYLAEHGRPAAIKHHVNVFCWYSRYLKPTGVVLDWGCNHGPDSCMIRHVLGDTAELHACDMADEAAFPAFRNYARPNFKQLNDTVRLPYGDAMFDVVVGSGVLEHVAMDYESLKELHRIMKPDGFLAISFLPYFLSWTEWYQRRIRKQSYHRRLYGRAELSQLLKRTGFFPEEIRFHTYVPDRFRRHVLRGTCASLFSRMKTLVRPLRSPLFRHTTLCCVARKVTYM
jgi:ubiquinone/menaquinone biosynthesis C-methylase UbiE